MLLVPPAVLLCACLPRVEAKVEQLRNPALLALDLLFDVQIDVLETALRMRFTQITQNICGLQLLKAFYFFAAKI
jgi:hypothetical protein